jgi:hypothetical protein
MMSGLNNLFALGLRNHRPHRPGTHRAGKPRRVVPLVEALERRDLLALSLAGPLTSTYGDLVQYTAAIDTALGSGAPANGTLHLFVDNVERAAHTLTTGDVSNGNAASPSRSRACRRRSKASSPRTTATPTGCRT